MKLVTGFALVIFSCALFSTTALQLGSTVHTRPSGGEQESENVSSYHATANVTQAGANPRQEQEATYWRYTPENFIAMKPRNEPHINGTRQETIIKPGEVLKVRREEQGKDGVLYLQLEKGGGWLFDKKPGVGTMCVREAFMDASAFVEATGGDFMQVAKNTSEVHTTAVKAPTPAKKLSSQNFTKVEAGTSQRPAANVNASRTPVQTRSMDKVQAAGKAPAQEMPKAEVKASEMPAAQLIAWTASHPPLQSAPAEKATEMQPRQESARAEPSAVKATAAHALVQNISKHKVVRRTSTRKAAGKKGGVSVPAREKFVAVHRSLKNHSVKEVAAGIVARSNRTRLGLVQRAVKEGDAASRKGELVSSKAAVHEAAVQSLEQEGINLNFTAPELIEAGLEISQTAFGLGQTQVNLTRNTMCKGGYRPTLLRTGQYTCDLPYEKGTVRYFFHNFLQFILAFFNFSRIFLSMIFIIFACMGTFVLEVFYFRPRNKVPHYEIIGTDMSEENPALEDPKKLPTETQESGSKAEPSVEGPLAGLTSEVIEEAKLVASMPEFAPRKTWGLGRFVLRFVPRPWQCRRRRSPA